MKTNLQNDFFSALVVYVALGLAFLGIVIVIFFTQAAIDPVLLN